MKKIITLIAGLFIGLVSFGQNNPVIKDTTIKNVTYHVYQGSRGGTYIIVTSASGTAYKKYFKKETGK